MDEQRPPGGAAMHVPVLRERVLALLAPALVQPGAVVVDATLGLGGHAAALLAAHPELRLIGIDRDPQALARSADRLAAHRERITLVHAVYDALPDVLADAGVEPVLPGLPESVEVARRGPLVTLVNHGGARVDLAVAGVDAATGERVDGVVLEPFGWRILRCADAASSARRG